MKNFLQHLAESQKTYEFRIKLADIDPADHIDRLKNALEAYGLESLSGAKRLPIKEHDVDFPSRSNCQIYLMDAVLKYPVNDQQLCAIIAERAGYPLASIIVVPKNSPEEQRRWNLEGNDVREFKKGETVLGQPYDAPTAEQQAASRMYSEAGNILKELNQVKIESVGNDTTIGGEKDPAYGTTTNDITTGELSPVGSNKNKIPSAVKGK